MRYVIVWAIWSITVAAITALLFEFDAERASLLFHTLWGAANISFVLWLTE
jgi:hypothetical protein